MGFWVQTSLNKGPSDMGRFSWTGIKPGMTATVGMRRGKPSENGLKPLGRPGASCLSSIRRQLVENFAIVSDFFVIDRQWRNSRQEFGGEAPRKIFEKRSSTFA